MLVTSRRLLPRDLADQRPSGRAVGLGRCQVGHGSPRWWRVTDAPPLTKAAGRPEAGGRGPGWRGGVRAAWEGGVNRVEPRRVGFPSSGRVVA
ncbi:hypothetical protein NL676_021913 [Syzygium grande]|nr:hypothetical protein NL676_021913 [Syzygium grande]